MESSPPPLTITSPLTVVSFTYTSPSPTALSIIRFPSMVCPSMTVSSLVTTASFTSSFSSFSMVLSKEDTASALVMVFDASNVPSVRPVINPATLTAPMEPFAHAGIREASANLSAASVFAVSSFALAIITAASALVMVALGLNVPSS